MDPRASEQSLAQAYRAAKQHLQAGQPEEAERLLRHILQQSPGHADTLHLLGLLKHQQGYHEAAAPLLTEAARRKPQAAAFHNNLGNVYRALGRLHEAEAAYEQALRLKPRYAGALYNLGLLYSDQGRLGEALARYRQALEAEPGHLEAQYAVVALAGRQGRLDEAEAGLRQVLRRHPDEARAHYELGRVLQVQGCLPEAVACFRAAVRGRPDAARAHNDLGAALLQCGVLDEPEACFRRALALQPELSEARYNLAYTLENRGRLEEARTAYEEVAARPCADATRDLCSLSLLRLKLADWQDYEARRTVLVRQVAAYLRQPDAAPLPLMTLNYFAVPPALHKALARQHGQGISRQMAALKNRCAFVHTRQQPAKLRLGYVSPDFREHAVGLLIHDVFARHDRAAFEVYAYSLVPVDDAYTRRIRAGCDAFVDISRLSPEAAARRIHGDGVHLLIDLGGYTSHTRPEVFALEPAPVQALYLGYPNTTGADYIDYLLTDEWIVPEALAPYYTEQIVA